jgi:hypothetical protein
MKIVISLLLVITFLSTVHEASTAPEPAPEGVTVGPITGTVLETMDAAGYTYMRLKTAKGEIWAAVQKTTVKKGSEVTVLNAVSMDGFESKTLKRKFDHIVFGKQSPRGLFPACVGAWGAGRQTGTGDSIRATR